LGNFVRKLLIMVALCFVLVCNGLSANNYNLPQLGSSANTIMNPWQEAELGAQFMQLIKRQLPLSRDPVVIQYIQNLGQRLVSASQKPFQSFYFFVVNDASVNAFAGPGGYVGINTGTILAATSEAELAGVMAHEVAHVTQRHIARGIAAQKKTQLASIAGMLAAAVLGMLNPQAGMAAMSGVSAGGAQHLINFTRAHEEEADRVGVKILVGAGYPASGMSDFFKHMQAQERYNGRTRLPETLLTHPLANHRMSEAENMASQYSKKQPYKKRLLFQLIQSRVLVETSQHLKKLNRLLLRASSKKNLASRYALALVQYKLRHYKKALAMMQALVKVHPDVAVLILSKAKMLLANRKPTQALALMHQLNQDNAEDYAIMINYAKALIQLKQYKKARQMLEQTHDSFASDDIYLSLLAQAQGRSGQLAKAYVTRAALFHLNGADERALIQLKQAKRFSKTPYERRMITKKINQLAQLDKNRRLR
jgi:beta-barrel assembly-enhancing protease